MQSEPILVVVRIARLFDELEIPYLVGGSFASSVYGTPRATQDVDLVAQIEIHQAEEIASALKADFYVDADMVRDAVRRRGSFNVIHLPTMFKADVFIARADPWSLEEMKRAQHEQIELMPGERPVRFASPEDTLLHKLVWYRLGNEVSDRQWSDVMGILRIQGESLDTQYLKRWASVLGVADLLLRATQQQ